MLVGQSAEFIVSEALEGIDRRPDELVVDFAEHGSDARADPVRFEFPFAVDVPAELEIDAPDVVGLLMQKRQIAGLEIWLEPEPPLDPEVRGNRTSAIRKLSSKTRKYSHCTSRQRTRPPH